MSLFLKSQKQDIVVIYLVIYCLKLKVNVYIFSLDICKFDGLVHAFSQSHFAGENVMHFLQLMLFTMCQISFHLVSVTAGWAEAVWFQNFAQDFT